MEDGRTLYKTHLIETKGDTNEGKSVLDGVATRRNIQRRR
jgi:hypothetical protein